MNYAESLEYEEKRKAIAKSGSQNKKTTGALAAFTAQLLKHDEMNAAYKQDYESGREYAKKQYGASMTAGKTFAILKKLEERIGLAHEKQPDLIELGEYIAFKTNTTWIQGPLKVVGGTKPTDRGAYNKTVNDYSLDWTANKDLIRGTCAARTESELLGVVARIQIICGPVYGMSLIKRQEVKPSDPKNACGYSGWNFAVVMKGSSIPAEIQANTWSMMYGKMSKSDYSSAFLGSSDAEYVRTRNEMGFEGGLGHLFYEIWQKDKSGPDGKVAAELSRRYSDMCRMPPSSRGTEVTKVTALIDKFHTLLKTQRAKDIWASRANH